MAGSWPEKQWLEEETLLRNWPRGVHQPGQRGQRDAHTHRNLGLDLCTSLAGYGSLDPSAIMVLALREEER